MQNPEEQYIDLLSQLYPDDASAEAQIIQYCSEMGMPKESEYFISDIHGEYAAFSHILRNACGSIREYISELLGSTLSDKERAELATLVYYPKQKIELVEEEGKCVIDWCDTMLPYVLDLASGLACRHTPEQLAEYANGPYGELAIHLIQARGAFDSDAFGQQLFRSTLEAGASPQLIAEIAHIIKRLSVEHVHMVGDVFDRGPYPELIMEELMQIPSLDIAWGNHDIVWMGAALGQWGCIAHVVRNCARYGNLSILEESYGINLRPLASFAMQAYADDPCAGFALKGNPGLSEYEHLVNVKIQKAMAILQFKVEAQLSDDNPSFGLDDRKLLHKIDLQSGTVEVDGTEYTLTDPIFPTVDWEDPYKLTDEEQAAMEALERAFVGSEKLQRHVEFLLEAGSLYKIYNGNLIFHACVPLNEDGSLKEVDVFGRMYKGRALYDICDYYVREAFKSTDPAMRKRGRDFIWYLWLGEGSPLFAKSKMATFEIYLCAEKPARKEVKNPFYSLFDEPRVFDAIFEDFGLDPQTAHIVCGHVPVKVKDGEDPVKCDAKVFCIDGGFSSAYQGTTGIAGFTLVYDSAGYRLYSHKPLPSQEQAIAGNLDIYSDCRDVIVFDRPETVAATDEGAMLSADIEALEDLIESRR